MIFEKEEFGKVIPDETPEETIARALLLAQKIIEKREERIKNLKNHIIETKLKMEFPEKILKSKECIDIHDYAKILRDENIGVSEKGLYKWFRDNGYLKRSNVPYQKLMHLFAVQESTWKTAFGPKLAKTTLVTPEGQIYFFSKLYKFKNKEWKNA